MRRFFYAILLAAMLPVCAFGQKTVHVATAGTLPTLISDAEKYTIENLTVTGQLNGTDLRLLRDMAGNNWQGNLTDGKLSTLDLSGATIVEGGEKYVDTDRIYYDKEGSWKDNISFNTVDNVFPPYAFMGCNSLQVIKLPSTVVEIGKCAFAIGMLTSITVPSTVRIIGQQAFYDCDRLTTFEMPAALTSIGRAAFSYTGLTAVTLPAGVTEIGKMAFNGSNNLKEIYACMAEPCTIDAKTFSVFDTAKLYVPNGSAAAYQAADNWNKFSNMAEFNPTGIHGLQAEGPYDVFSLQGRHLVRGATSLEGLSRGIYIVNGRKHVIK